MSLSGPVMVSNTLCPAVVHISETSNVYNWVKSIAEDYWLWAVFSLYLNQSRAADLKGTMSYRTQGGGVLQEEGLGTCGFGGLWRFGP